MSDSEGIDEAGWGELLKSQLQPPHPDVLPQRAHEAAQLETGTRWGSHVFGEYRRCHRASTLRRSGLVPVGSTYDRLDYLGIGGAVHAVLSYGWGEMARGNYDVNPIDALRAATQRPGGIAADTYDEALRLCEAYYARWGFPDWKDGARVVCVEELLSDGEDCTCGIVLGGAEHAPGCGMQKASFALPYTARLDLVLDVCGEITLVDTKTRAKSFPTDVEGYRRDLRTREQFLGQCFLAMRRWRLSTPPPLIVNAIVKTKIPKFERLRIVPTLADVERWAENHAREALAGLDDDTMNYSACAPEIGSRCDFIRYCHGSEEERARGFAMVPR